MVVGTRVEGKRTDDARNKITMPCSKIAVVGVAKFRDATIGGLRDDFSAVHLGKSEEKIVATNEVNSTHDVEFKGSGTVATANIGFDEVHGAWNSCTNRA